MRYKTFRHSDNSLWAAIGEFGYDPKIRSELGGVMSSDDHSFWIVAFDGQKVAGFSSLKTKRRLLAHAYVFPDYREQGVCDQMIKIRLDLAKELELSKVQIVIRPDRLGHYEAYGFKKRYERGKYYVCELSLDK